MSRKNHLNEVDNSDQIDLIDKELNDDRNYQAYDQMYVKDWRKALRTPPTYRIGNRTLRLNYNWLIGLFGLAIVLLIWFYTGSRGTQSSGVFYSWTGSVGVPYNFTYPITKPLTSNGIYKYRIGLISDMDTDSKSLDVKNQWISFYKKGYIVYNREQNQISVSFDSDKPIQLTSNYALKGRGMELSELLTFDGHLHTFDDRTGLVFRFVSNEMVPWVILMDGNGRTSKGFKSEWATVKDEHMYVGSMGKEWTSPQGEFVNNDPMYVKRISPTGEVFHVSWEHAYKALRSAIGISWPGYMIHESGMWSAHHRKWFFLPRRCSKERYNETRDEQMGCNVLLITDEDFSHIKVIELAPYKRSHGFSSFKFMPNTHDSIIVAIQSEEVNGKMGTYITAFTIGGEILLDQQKLNTELKYEGFDFI